MNIIAQNKRYLPHEITTKESAVKLYRLTKDVSFVCRRYHISKASLMRWNKLYDGTKESLLPNSHKPHTIHPNAHTPEELKWIMDLHRRNKNISVCEMYTKLREKHAYSRHPGSLYRVFVQLCYRKKVESTKKKSRHNGHYDTPTELGVKWQDGCKICAFCLLCRHRRREILPVYNDRRGKPRTIYLPVQGAEQLFNG